MISSNDNRIVFPLFLFFDDFECGNALGSHSGINKLGAIYALVPCLPPHMVSQLSSILLVSLFYSSDRKIFGNKSICKLLIKELNDLKKNGIKINVANVEYCIYFECGLILGDNLGLNSIFGFVESFSANYSCRICSVHKLDSRKMIVEDKNLLRTINSYNVDLAKNHYMLSGIKESCIFHEIDGFHIATHQSVDIMHDIFEGSANYTITAILDHLIYKDKLFTLDVLNSRIETFNYGALERSNKPLPISASYMKTNQTLKMSAAEMACFSRYLGLMIGDLVPRTNEVWKLYLKLREIIDLITAPRVLPSYAILLENKISEHHSLYMKFFGHLKPKFHNMIHYPRLLLQNGPFIHHWSMRFESKNREMRQCAVSTSCKKNLLKTISIKHQLQLCHASYCFNSLQNKITYGPSQLCADYEVAYFDNVPRENIKSYKYIHVHGKKLLFGSIILRHIDDDGPVFGKIAGLYEVNNTLYIVMYSIKTIAFDKHYHAYLVHVSNTPNTYLYIYNYFSIYYYWTQ